MSTWHVQPEPAGTPTMNGSNVTKWRQAVGAAVIVASLLLAVLLFVVVMVSIVQDRPRPKQPYDGPVPSGPCLASPPAGCA
jgi:hypothetical protein